MGSGMNTRATSITGVMVVQTQRVEDQRGAFARLFCEEELRELMGARRIVQINHSKTAARGAVRGMHLQVPPHAEMKLVRCSRGKVWDVAVDMRAGSPTFLRWHAEELSSANARMLVIPEGCAHGFQVLEADSELLYLHTAAYAPEAERGFDCQDPMLAIDWPLPVGERSARDLHHPAIEPGFQGLTL
jgi:dTDP-4-dehydrorhamnose 3,5-epimerase